MAIVTIQNRRGLRDDFDPEKMLPGEWAVSTDRDTGDQVVWMCFQAGSVKRMGTYEDLSDHIERISDDIKRDYAGAFQTMTAYVEEMEAEAVQKAREAADSARGAADSAGAAAQAAQGAVQDSAAALTASREAQEGSQAALAAAREAGELATTAAAGASKDAEDAKEAAGQALSIAQGAKLESGAAIAAAQNAQADVGNALGEVADAQGAVDAVVEENREIRLSLAGKVDGAYAEDGYLYLTSDGEVVAGPLGPFAGGGGGGGTGGNNAVLSVSNASGWLSRTIAYGAACTVSLTWSSIEDGIPTGNGSMRITVNGALGATLDIAQGEVTVDLAGYLGLGANAVKVNVSDAYGNSRTVNFNITTVSISLSSTFDAGTPFTGPVTFTYVPVGSVSKTVHFILDGEEMGTSVTNASGRQQTYVVPAQAHGAHTLEVYFTAMIGGEEVTSERLYYELICTEPGNMTPIITSSFAQTEASQYDSLTIRYRVYDPSSLTAAVTLSADGEVVAALTVDRTEQAWTYRADAAGPLVLTIASGTAVKAISLTVTGNSIDVGAETDALALHLSSYGRSNSEAAPGTWAYGDIQAQFTGFDFVSDGWQMDGDRVTVLRVSGDARLYIPAEVFAQDPRGTGKTIEVEFATRAVMDYDAVILSCMSGGRGIQLTAQQALLRSEQTVISTQYKEDEHVRIAFVIEERSSGHRLLYTYINGIMSGAVQYPDDDDFSQPEPVGISVGSSDCAIDLYCIRVYDNDLTRHQVLDNWIADTQDGQEMLRRYARNNVSDAYGQVVMGQLPPDLPYLVLQAAELPQYKGDKKTVSGYYVDPQDGSRSFSFEGAQIDVQGTSSQYYARKNYKIKFKGGFVMEGASEPSGTYAMRPDSIPTDTFTFKADVASSEGANNVELVRLYNDACPYRTPPQVADGRVRQGIDGFPIVVFWDDGTGTSFVGKYNFNNDKGTEEVFGFAAGDESWEIKNNTSDRVLWKSDDLTGTDWLNDFEGRFPDGNEDPVNLQRLSSWLASTDQDAVQSPEEKAARLDEFRAELPSYMEKDAVIFYYLFTELFLMVDSRAKNAFPTAYLSRGGKWFSLPYDFDTAIGINNEGSLAFGYDLEDTDQTAGGADVFNGQQSVLWVNLRQAFPDDIRAMYQQLRSTGALSYADTERRFEEHQAKWPEAIFNEDSYFKYLAPLVEDGSAAYLSMLQGSKAEQRKWWLYNRFRYLDSKYNAGDALSDVITVRGYAKADITVRPYADIYASIKYGSYLVQERALRGGSYTLRCPLDNVNDTEIYIYSASQLADVGDLSGLMVGYAEFSMATRIQSLKLGDGDAGYRNGNLTDLHLGNNTLLRVLDVRNCPNLSQPVDVSGCTGLREVYMEGTGITGIQLPVGGVLRVLHLPGSIANLTIRGQAAITDLSIPTYANISTLRLEDVSAAVDSRAILEAIPAGSRVRIIGFDWDAGNAEGVYGLYARFDAMRGLDGDGGNTARAQLSGTIRVDAFPSADIERLRESYPDITIRAGDMGYYLRFWDDSGDVLLYEAAIYDGGDGAYGGTVPTKEPQGQYGYTFAGWSRTPGGAADDGALLAVTADRDVYAVFASYIRTFTVRFINDGTVVQITRDVAYGGSVAYAGSTPTKTGVEDPESYTFTGWDPAPEDIRADTDCHAQYSYEAPDNVITDSWEEITAAVDAGTYLERYALGDMKALDLGTEGVIRMQIVAFDTDDLSDGSGKAAISWISEQLLPTPHRLNPAASKTEDGAYVEGTGSVGGWERCEMRAYIKDTIGPLIPEDVRSHIKTVTKEQYAYDTAGTRVSQTTEDDVWIPSYREVYAASGQTRIYPWFDAASKRAKKKPGASSNSAWATRQASSATAFYGINTSGNNIAASTSNAHLTALGFCI